MDGRLIKKMLRATVIVVLVVFLSACGQMWYTRQVARDGLPLTARLETVDPDQWIRLAPRSPYDAPTLFVGLPSSIGCDFSDDLPNAHLVAADGEPFAIYGVVVDETGREHRFEPSCCVTPTEKRDAAVGLAPERLNLDRSTAVASVRLSSDRDFVATSVTWVSGGK